MKKQCLRLVATLGVLFAAGSALAQSERPNRKELTNQAVCPEVFQRQLRYLMRGGLDSRRDALRGRTTTDIVPR